MSLVVRLTIRLTILQLPVACSTVNHTASDRKLGDGLHGTASVYVVSKDILT